MPGPAAGAGIPVAEASSIREIFMFPLAIKRTLPVLCVTLVAHATCAADAPARPNLVVILADDLGYGDLGCYGATKVKTPHMDRLGREGMRFLDAHSPHSVCTPTRYGLLTGRYCWRTWAQSRGVWANDPLLIDTRRLTLPGLLQSAGYRTACVGKWHLGFGSPETPGWDDQNGPDYNRRLAPGPLEVGFDYFFGIPHVGQLPHIYIQNHRVVGLRPDDPLRIVLDPRSRRRTSFRERIGAPPAHRFEGGRSARYRHEDVAVTLTDKAVAWIESQPGEPFFLYFAHRNVHAPLRPHPRFRGTSEIGVYGDFINELDWSVGRVLDALDRRGFAKNTLLIVSSDNGAVQMGHQPADVVDYRGHKANGPWRGQKTEVYEGGHRVPLIARWPGHVAPGSKSNDLVALTDLLATVAELLGETLPDDAGEDSFSFLHVLEGRRPAGAVRRAIVHDSNLGAMAVRQDSWKLITIQGGGGIGWSKNQKNPEKPPGQLYNLADDPAERDNLYEKRPEIVARLTRLLHKIQKSGRSRD